MGRISNVEVSGDGGQYAAGNAVGGRTIRNGEEAEQDDA